MAFPGPTPSQRTNELVALLAGVAADPTSMGEAEALLRARLEELDQLWPAFREGIQGSELPPGALHPAERVDEAFGAYRQALEEALEALQRPSRLEPAAWELAQAGTGLHQAMRDYEWSFVTSGATRFPLLNLLHRLRDTVASPAGADLAQVAAWSRPLLEQTADDMRQDPRLGVLAAAFERASAALAAPEGGPAVLAELERACAEVEHALLAEQAPPAPPSSWLEAVVVSARAYLQGAVPRELVLEALEALEFRLVASYQEFEQAARHAGLAGPLLQEELDRARDRFALLNEAVDGTRSALDGRGDLEPCLRALEESGRALLESRRFFEESEDHPSQVACPRCGHLNGAGARICSACAARLPRREDAPESTELPESGTVHSEHLLELLQAAEKAALGEISVEQFNGYLRWGCDLVVRGREALETLPQVDLDDPDAEALVERTREGLDEFQAGLEELSAWAGGGGREFLRSGTRRLLRGGQRLEGVRRETT